MADMGCRQLRPLLLSKHVLRKTFVCAVVRFQRRTTPAFAVSPEYSGVERSGVPQCFIVQVPVFSALSQTAAAFAARRVHSEPMLFAKSWSLTLSPLCALCVWWLKVLALHPEHAAARLARLAPISRAQSPC
jgi:hypothetical protein